MGSEGCFSDALRFCLFHPGTPPVLSRYTGSNRHPGHLPYARQSRLQGAESTIGALARDAIRFFKCKADRFITDLIDNA